LDKENAISNPWWLLKKSLEINKTHLILSQLCLVEGEKDK